MRTIKPYYYDKFQCIADKCPYTCCQEWDISVDDKTLANWRKMQTPGEEASLLSRFIKVGNSEQTLRFNKEKKCHLLNENGLCRVVLAYGEEQIPCTYHVFPREENLYSDHIEKMLSPACPYVLDLLWEKEGFELVQAEDGSVEGSKSLLTNSLVLQKTAAEEAAFALRDRALQLLQTRPENTGAVLKALFCIFRDLCDQKAAFTKSDIEAYMEETDLDELFRVVTLETDSDETLDERFFEQNELFLDVVDRYIRQKKYETFLKGIVPEAEKLSRLDHKDTKAMRAAAGRCEKEFEEKLRLLLCEEVACYLVSECSMEAMLVKLEWLILLYVVIKQAVFLRWNKAQSLSYEEFRETVTIMNRIMGYADAEICQFLKTEFEDLIWPMDYIFLVL